MRRLGIALGLLFVIGCRRDSAPTTELRLPAVPLPSAAVAVQRTGRPGGGEERSFVVPRQEQLDGVRDFYRTWARENRWRQLPSSEESWSSDEWTTFVDRDGQEVRQRLVHWADPQRQWSLRLALITKNAQSRAWVIVAPFMNLDQLPTPAASPPKVASPSRPAA